MCRICRCVLNAFLSFFLSKKIEKINPKFYEKNDKNKNGDFLKIVVLPSKNNDFQGSGVQKNNETNMKIHDKFHMHFRVVFLTFPPLKIDGKSPKNRPKNGEKTRAKKRHTKN